MGGDRMMSVQNLLNPCDHANCIDADAPQLPPLNAFGAPRSRMHGTFEICNISGTWRSNVYTISSISTDNSAAFHALSESTECARTQGALRELNALQTHSDSNASTTECPPQDVSEIELPASVKRSRERRTPPLPATNTTNFKKSGTDPARRNAANSVQRTQTQASSLYKYHCKYCPMKFETKTLRKDHMTAEHPKPFACGMCSGRFNRKYDYEKHYLTVHERIRPFTCSECEKAFGQKHHLLRHMDTIHLKAKVFDCEHCGSSFGRKEHLQNHVKSVHKQFNYSCALCNDGFYEKSNALQHLDTDHKVKVVNPGTFLVYPARIGVKGFLGAPTSLA